MAWDDVYASPDGRGDLSRSHDPLCSCSGSAGEKLHTCEDPNAPGSAPIYLGDFSNGPLGRLVPQYSAMNERNNNGYSRYNALVLGVDSRGIGSTGLSFTACYTYGHAKCGSTSRPSSGRTISD